MTINKIDYYRQELQASINEYQQEKKVLESKLAQALQDKELFMQEYNNHLEQCKQNQESVDR